jgi:hypothetical protein
METFISFQWQQLKIIVYPAITERDNEKYEYDPKGLIFITVGTGERISMILLVKRLRSSFNFRDMDSWNIDIVENGRRLNVNFYENRDNREKDHFTIKK